VTVKATDTLIRHAKSLYNALQEKAEPEEVQGGTLTVFRGSVTHLYDELGISRSYYTPIITFLRENDCVSFLRRGSRSVESVVVLHREPSAEGMSLPPLTGRSHGAKVEARLKQLEISTGGINIAKALSDHEKRLKRLESRSKGR
jgi:hypothetical protein